MKKLLPIFVLSLLAVSCTSKYAIEGSATMSNIDGKMVFIKIYKDDAWMTIDSAEIVHGLFSIKGKTDSVMMTSLYLDNQGVMPLVLENGKIKVSLAYDEISARGTQLNNLLYDFLDEKDDLEKELYDLERKEARLVLEGRDIDEIRPEIALERDGLVKKLDDTVKRFIISNADNVLGSYVFILLGNSLPYPLLTPQIEDILKDAPYSLKSDPVVRDFVNKAKENMELIREHQRVESNSLKEQNK